MKDLSKMTAAELVDDARQAMQVIVIEAENARLLKGSEQRGSLRQIERAIPRLDAALVAIAKLVEGKEEKAKSNSALPEGLSREQLLQMHRKLVAKKLSNTITPQEITRLALVRFELDCIRSAELVLEIDGEAPPSRAE